MPQEEGQAMTWGDIKMLNHPPRLWGNSEDAILLTIMLSCLLTVLHVISQLPNAEFKCLLSEGIKGTPVIQDSIILFCHVKGYHLGPIG